MAVAKSKKSKSRRDMKRWAHAAVENPQISTDQTTGEKHLRHHVTKEGFYRGKQVVSDNETSETQE